RFWDRLMGRAPAPVADTPPSQPPAKRPETPTTQDFSLTSGPKKSLAVIPFRNLSGDPQADFYGLSLADSLITELAKSHSVMVKPSSYVTKYQGQMVDPLQIRNELGVELVLTGNFLKAGDRLRVTAQLVDATGGGMLWSEKIDADAADALAIQDRISQKIISGLSVRQVALDPTQLLRDEDEEVRIDAVRTLKFSHDPRALSVLVEALRDASLKVKAEAVQALVHMGEQATGPVIQLLNDAVDEDNYLTARYAAKALGLIGDRSISPVLVELLRSEDRFVACEAILALGRLQEVKAVPALIDLLEDPNGNVRFAAAEALGHICDLDARRALQKRLNDDDEGVRAKARWALSRLKKKVGARSTASLTQG
ncbi:MAG TPA: HEAT repeat domain-containing protein, partial [Blastocatellia bacterium]|nr:HEAT repeat domain-containing protein [Blastocatellia bacterium]